MKRQIKTLEELRALDGKKITCVIEGKQIDDCLVVASSRQDHYFYPYVYLLQNIISGMTTKDLKGYKYSYIVTKANINYLENIYYEDTTMQPELKAGMVVQLEGSDKYLLVMPKPGYDDCLILMDRIGRTSPILGVTHTNKIYEIPRTSSYYMFFNNSHDDLPLKLMWSKQPDNAAKIAELQEALDKLDREHAESVKEIREQLRRLK